MGLINVEYQGRGIGNPWRFDGPYGPKVGYFMVITRPIGDI